MIRYCVVILALQGCSEPPECDEDNSCPSPLECTPTGFCIPPDDMGVSIRPQPDPGFSGDLGDMAYPDDGGVLDWGPDAGQGAVDHGLFEIDRPDLMVIDRADLAMFPVDTGIDADLGPDLGIEPDLGVDVGVECYPVDERCDGLIDNDCDGYIDEDFYTGAPCLGMVFRGDSASLTEGVCGCGEDGRAVCIDQQNITRTTFFIDRDNGIDDDCDGDAEEGFLMRFTQSRLGEGGEDRFIMSRESGQWRMGFYCWRQAWDENGWGPDEDSSFLWREDEDDDNYGPDDIALWAYLPEGVKWSRWDE